VRLSFPYVRLPDKAFYVENEWVLPIRQQGKMKVDDKEVMAKRARLVRLLRDKGSPLIAYSGGVDSTFLLALAHEALNGQVTAATAISEILPVRERELAEGFARKRGIEHILLPWEVTSLPAFISNRPDRCYHCKRSLFRRCLAVAKERGRKCVAHGANLDDLKDYRPGQRAASEMGILSPLIDVGLNKLEIRHLSKDMGLSSWNRPSTVCLASRVPYGSPITAEKLRMIDEAEAFLLKGGVRQCRVRHHGTVARIEVASSDLAMLMKDGFRDGVLRRLKDIGFAHVALDMEGYVPGSMNRVLGTETNGEKMDDA
jgi:uncharacterized protein